MMNDYPWPMPAGVASVQGAAELAAFGELAMDDPAFSEQLAALRRACRLVGRDVPVLETVFNPWGIAKRTMRRHAARLLAEHPQQMLDWLEVCTKNLVRYIRAAAATGIAGIYFSVNGAEADGMSDAGFEKFVKPFDLRAIEAAAGVGPVLIGHIHGKNLRFARIWEYPFPALSWSHLHDNESMAAIRARTGRCLVGGMDEFGTAQLTPADVVASVLAAAKEAEGGGFIAGPGCAVPNDIPPDLIRAPREAVEKLRK
jgi:uroporphyrinogen decarboxylase